ncbi:MAG: hypothetical protein ACPG19_13995, partial [Saprospiraceae bacterium]
KILLKKLLDTINLTDYLVFIKKESVSGSDELETLSFFDSKPDKFAINASIKKLIFLAFILL